MISEFSEVNLFVKLRVSVIVIVIVKRFKNVQVTDSQPVRFKCSFFKFENISLKISMALLLGILLLYKVVMSSCQEFVVNRNVRDTFRVGNVGCKNNSSICTTRSATCQTDGWCLCNENSPNFRNPVIERFDKYGETYGCVKSEYILDRVGERLIFGVIYLS